MIRMPGAEAAKRVDRLLGMELDDDKHVIAELLLAIWTASLNKAHGTGHMP